MLLSLLLDFFFFGATYGVTSSVMIQSNGASVQLTKCDWLFKGNISGNLITASQNTGGFYYCNKTKELLLLVVFDEFVRLSGPTRSHFMLGDELSLRCVATLMVGMYMKLYSVFKLMNSTGIEIETVVREVNSRNVQEYTIAVQYKTIEYGEQSFHCSLYMKWSYEDLVMETIIFSNISLSVYAAPALVVPDKLVVAVNKTVTCSSYGYPVPNFTWMCSDGNWSSSKERLIIHARGKFNCSCKASVQLLGTLKEAEWHGSIDVVDGSEMKRLTGIVITISAVLHFWKLNLK